ncbi:MAG: hypothetical protein ACKV2U_29845 [Bryobacteraceae bacterium]|jgi:bifunctional N-acetylglucosamine-1-phosphate-uridyltransferase/glucosamine-1-phosphate-acetyltransferase GlmU-like protein
MEHEARFNRIEAVLERLADAQLRGEYALTDAVEHMARSHKQLLTAQVLMVDEHRKLAEAQTRTEKHMDELSIKSAETQGKLDALIHMWDNWIRERGGKNGTPPAN